MTALLNHDYRIAGTVKFDASVPIERLSALLIELKARGAERWVDLHVRGAGSDGTHHIAFHYILEDGKKRAHKKAVHRLLQYLRDRLGTRPKRGSEDDPVPVGVIEWDIATVKVMI